MFLFWKYIALLFWGTFLSETNANITEAEFASHFEIVYKALARQEALIQAQEQAITELKHEARVVNTEHTKQIQAQAQSIRELKLETHALRDVNMVNAEKPKQIQDLQAQLDQHISQAQCDLRNIYHEFGCDHENITLSCAQDQWINVTYALYGMNSAPCSDTCCPPVPSDCSELVSENDLANWLSLKYACDNQTTCSYQYSGAIINECEMNYVADYMHIFYDCLPVLETAVIGFTARLSTSEDYEVGDMVRFDLVNTNYGNHYQPSTGYFTCPRHGIYLFGLNINSLDDSANLDLMVGDFRAVEVFVGTPGYNGSGVQVIIECHVGEIVWVKCGQTSYVHSTQNNNSQFFGAFLHNME